MRRTLIIALAVLALSAGTCLGCAAAIDRAVGAADRMRLEAVALACQNRPEAARQLLTRLAAEWEARGRALELMLSHDALSEVRSGIADAALCLDAGDRQEFLRAAAALGFALERIRDAEDARLKNLF